MAPFTAARQLLLMLLDRTHHPRFNKLLGEKPPHTQSLSVDVTLAVTVVPHLRVAPLQKSVRILELGMTPNAFGRRHGQEDFRHELSACLGPPDLEALPHSVRGGDRSLGDALEHDIEAMDELAPLLHRETPLGLELLQFFPAPRGLGDLGRGAGRRRNVVPQLPRRLGTLFRGLITTRSAQSALTLTPRRTFSGCGLRLLRLMDLFCLFRFGPLLLQHQAFVLGHRFRP